jgi:putative GTP pyrophosphokinase
MLQAEFRIVERSDKGAELIAAERFGYQSIHYLVKLSAARARLPEYQPFAGTIAEIQVRTILQHAWAEIEHDIQYKSSAVIPVQIHRRFMALSGMLEIADREFQGIQDADHQLTVEARARVEGGDLDRVEITPDALKAFLDKRIGPDGRMSEYTYDWTARMVRDLGFRTLQQVEKCIDGYGDDQLSRIVTGGRQGQTVRFEFMLLAGMGENFIKRHSYGASDWFQERQRKALEALGKEGISVGHYDPFADVTAEAVGGDEEAGGQKPPPSDAPPAVDPRPPPDEATP